MCSCNTGRIVRTEQSSMLYPNDFRILRCWWEVLSWTSDLTALCNFMGRGHTEEGLSAPGNRCQGSQEWHRAVPRGVQTGHRETFSYLRGVVRLWNRLPREVVGAMCQSVFKRHLDNAFSNMLFNFWLAMGGQAVGLADRPHPWSCSRLGWMKLI